MDLLDGYLDEVPAGVTAQSEAPLAAITRPPAEPYSAKDAPTASSAVWVSCTRPWIAGSPAAPVLTRSASSVRSPKMRSVLAMVP